MSLFSQFIRRTISQSAPQKAAASSGSASSGPPGTFSRLSPKIEVMSHHFQQTFRLLAQNLEAAVPVCGPSGGRPGHGQRDILGNGRGARAAGICPVRASANPNQAVPVGRGQEEPVPQR